MTHTPDVLPETPELACVVPRLGNSAGQSLWSFSRAEIFPRHPEVPAHTRRLSQIAQTCAGLEGWRPPLVPSLPAATSGPSPFEARTTIGRSCRERVPGARTSG